MNPLLLFAYISKVVSSFVYCNVYTYLDSKFIGLAIFCVAQSLCYYSNHSPHSNGVGYKRYFDAF